MNATCNNCTQATCSARNLERTTDKIKGLGLLKCQHHRQIRRKMNFTECISDIKFMNWPSTANTVEMFRMAI